MTSKQISNQSPRKPSPAFGGKVVLKQNVIAMPVRPGYYPAKQIELTIKPTLI